MAYARHLLLNKTAGDNLRLPVSPDLLKGLEERIIGYDMIADAQWVRGTSEGWDDLISFVENFDQRVPGRVTYAVGWYFVRRFFDRLPALGAADAVTYIGVAGKERRGKYHFESLDGENTLAVTQEEGAFSEIPPPIEIRQGLSRHYVLVEPYVSKAKSNTSFQKKISAAKALLGPNQAYPFSLMFALSRDRFQQGMYQSRKCRFYLRYFLDSTPNSLCLFMNMDSNGITSLAERVATKIEAKRRHTETA